MNTLIRLLLLLSLTSGISLRGENLFDALNQIPAVDAVQLETGPAQSALTGASESAGARAVQAACRLWHSDRWTDLEVAWFRQDNSQVRTFIVALFYTQVTDPDISRFPPFLEYISKFEKNESMARKAELEWVKANLSILREPINALLKGAKVNDK